MSNRPRLNKLIELMEEGKPAFGAFLSNHSGHPLGNLDDVIFAGNSGHDFLIIENEHVGMDFTSLSISLQSLLRREKVAAQGNLQADPTPLVRISPNAGEIAMNQWIIKQTLDHGAYGLVLPHMETVAEAQAAVAASRYVQREGDPDVTPVGERGWHSGAASYWGLTAPEYYDVADVWPLDPDGELILMSICETANGVKNLTDVLSQVKGIGAVWAGPGDLSLSMGKGAAPAPNNRDPNAAFAEAYDPQVREALSTILRSCKQHNVPCAVTATTPQEVEQRLEEGFRILMIPISRSVPGLAHARAVTNR